MPQFQIKRHPHGGTFQTFYLNSGLPTKNWNEANTVQECIDYIIDYADRNIYNWGTRFWLEVFPD